jgi:hypothetical protein
VRFLGYRENPYPVINEADIVLVCSRAEAFGRVAVEAMLLKKPVIGTNAGGTTELIRDGFNGFLYQGGQPRQLADRIEHLLDHEELIPQLGANGQAFARENFAGKRYGRSVVEQLEGVRQEGNPADSRFLDYLADGMIAFQAMSQTWQKALHTSEEEMRARSSEVAALNDEVRARDHQIATLNDQITALTDEVRARDHQVATLNDQVTALNLTVDGLGREIATMKETAGWMMLERYRRFKDTSRALAFAHSMLVQPLESFARRRAARTQKPPE